MNSKQIEDKELKTFFSSRGLSVLYDLGEVQHDGHIDPTPQNVIKPHLGDLQSIYALCEKTTRTTILEFGCGWSSYVFAAYLRQLKNEIQNFEGFRRFSGFKCYSVDNHNDFMGIAKGRIPTELQDFVDFHYSQVNMTNWNGRIATEYGDLPLVNPDLIYIDGPDQFGVEGNVNGISTRHKDFMPMVCDVLKIEHFLIPKTIILLDGRGANARFMKANLQRNWSYKYCENRDQHFFVLDEDPIGIHSKKIIDQLYYRNGNWSIDDL